MRSQIQRSTNKTIYWNGPLLQCPLEQTGKVRSEQNSRPALYAMVGGNPPQQSIDQQQRVFISTSNRPALDTTCTLSPLG